MAGFLSFSTTGVWARWFFVVGTCPMHCGRFRALLASTHEIQEQPEPPVVTNKNVSRQWQMSSGQSHPEVRITALCYCSLWHIHGETHPPFLTAGKESKTSERGNWKQNIPLQFIECPQTEGCAERQGEKKDSIKPIFLTEKMRQEIRNLLPAWGWVREKPTREAWT